MTVEVLPGSTRFGASLVTVRVSHNGRRSAAIAGAADVVYRRALEWARVAARADLDDLEIHGVLGDAFEAAGVELPPGL